MLEKFISVICVVENDDEIIKERLTAIHKQLKANYTDYEIILIDQNSNDSTVSKIDSLLALLPSIRHIRLSQIVKFDVALAAGSENAIGDYIVIMSLRRDPATCIPEMVQKCLKGAHVVVGVCPDAQTRSHRIAEPLINAVLAKFAFKLPRYATELRCLSREVVNVVTETGRYHHKFFTRISKAGFQTEQYAYSIIDDSRNEPRNLKDGLKEALRVIVFNTTNPLRWMSGLGVFASALAFLFSTYSILTNLIKGDVAPGWTTLVLFTSILFMFHFIIMAVFGEYLGRLLEDRNEQRDYSVLYERHSSVMLNENRVNVLQN
jgi:glycosyltransferase involved in cell wall biosynthesis